MRHRTLSPMATSRREPVRAVLSPLYYLHHAERQVQDLLLEAMAGSPLDAADYAIYSLIFESGQTTATRLADETGVPLTTMLDTVRSLERRGHVQRRPDPRDRRAMLVALTMDGLAVHRAAGVHFQAADAALRVHLDVDPQALSEALAALADAAARATQALSARRQGDAG